jgi:Polyketide cyclase / dehydrase and lipid transport
MADKTAGNGNQDAPLGRLKAEAGNLAGAMAGHLLESVAGRIEDSTGRLKEYADNGGGPGLKAALTGASKLAEGESGSHAMLSAGASAAKQAAGGLFGKGKGKGNGGGGGSGGGLKVTNIVESIDVGAPLRLVYDQWTEFAGFPSFMKKVEKVEQGEDAKLDWQAQIFLSHRGWESTIQQQLPDRRIVWTSKGQKGHVDGTVTFHELGPELTRILVVLEYYPQGFFEQTGNIWRAQGRRVRLELKHFRRHVMREVVLHPDDVEGWRGVIEDGEVVKDHETALQEEQASGDEAGDEVGHEAGDGDYEDEYAEDEADYDDEDEADDEGDDEDEADDAEPVGAGSRRSRRR